MSGWSLAGLALLNALFLVAGAALLWATRGWRAWTELFRLAGVAYLVGVAAVCLPLVWLLTFGIGPSPGLVAALVLAFVVAGLYAGRKRPRPVARLGGRRREPLAIVGVLCAAVAVVWLEAYFRVARAAGLEAFDAWSFWVPKAQAIFYFGGLDEQLFRELAGPTYPILIPTLESLAFHFMGSADTNALHVQFWLLLVGFIGAVAGLLRPRVPLVLVWPFLAALVLMPELAARAVAPQADLTLDYFFVVSALSLALFVRDREPWLLVPYGLLLAAATSTKREGQLLAACLVLAGVLTTWRERRWAWPRIVGVALIAFLATLPWRIWFGSRDLTGETPGTSLSQLWETVDRIWPSFRLVLELALSADLWLAVLPIALVAAVTALVFRRTSTSTLFLLTVGFAVLGFTWILWSIAALPIVPSDATPIPRAVGALTLLGAAFAPLLVWELVEER
jgi:hypothetical protein